MASLNDSKVDLPLHFCFCSIHLIEQNGTGLFDVTVFCSKIQINVALSVGEDFKSFVFKPFKELFILLKCFQWK